MNFQCWQALSPVKSNVTLGEGERNIQIIFQFLIFSSQSCLSELLLQPLTALTINLSYRLFHKPPLTPEDVHKRAHAGGKQMCAHAVLLLTPAGEGATRPQQQVFAGMWRHVSTASVSHLKPPAAEKPGRLLANVDGPIHYFKHRAALPVMTHWSFGKPADNLLLSGGRRVSNMNAPAQIYCPEMLTLFKANSHPVVGVFFVRNKYWLCAGGSTQ